ncbi:hypothetical protein COEREDRAFT_82645 [Coemansia reversa NRRL 1564]|uniref:polynucleotide adenylyltransferase n=1 Tax=Coemansia reversa (strain ATCC 12441 / NRRL 1564) TaxID=763665 RepID=A0A2G5B7B4_COERN|nr:hypothetical protein COEREDRAFT_82645 [Coemansia reversa NRRL 1564]|eukprot:PIA14617.1 hypothetical protein COEREDRAFT_82645 [Coemansia reversa NRRL 1564]
MSISAGLGQAGVKRFPSISSMLMTNKGKNMFNSDKYMPTSYKLMDRLRTLLAKDGKQQSIAGKKNKVKALPLDCALPHLNMLDIDEKPFSVQQVCAMIGRLNNIPYKPIMLAKLQTDSQGEMSLVLDKDIGDNEGSTYSWAVTYSPWVWIKGIAAASKELPSLQPAFLPSFDSIATAKLPPIIQRQEELNSELEELSHFWTPDKASMDAVLAAQDMIRLAARKFDMSVYCKLEVFGSRAYGICQSDSDFDFLMTIMHRKMVKSKLRERFISQLKSALRKTKSVPLAVYIRKAKVPIIKFQYQRGKRVYNGDISFEERSAILRTKMLKAYINMDPRVRTVLMLLKHWGVKRELTSKDVLNSYCMTMMGLAFLISQRVVPPLQLLSTTIIDDKAWDRLTEIHNSPEEISKLYPKEKSSDNDKSLSVAQCLQTGRNLPGMNVSGNNGYYLDDLRLQQVWKSPNKKSAFELAFEMFRFYGTEFDPKIHAISPRLGSPCILRSNLSKLEAPLPKKISLQSFGPQKGTHLLAIEDPLITSTNSGRKASVQWVGGLLWEMRRAAWAMAKGLEDNKFKVLDRLFLPPTANIYRDAGVWAPAYKRLISDMRQNTDNSCSDDVDPLDNHSTIKLDELEDKELMKISKLHEKYL